MATHLIRTPERGANDTVGSVRFVDGVAEVDENTHAAELRYFRSAGYGVEDIAPTDAPTDVVADVDGDGVPEKLPRRNASEASWRAFAVEHGMTPEQAEGLTRDELVAHYTKEAGQ